LVRSTCEIRSQARGHADCSHLERLTAPPPDDGLEAGLARWRLQRMGQGLDSRKLWIASYADFKLQTTDDALLDTYDPPGEAAGRHGFQMTVGLSGSP
jgi:hypothetical protein